MIDETYWRYWYSNEKKRERYNFLRELGFTSKEARLIRNYCKPSYEKIIKKRIKELQEKGMVI